MATVTVSLEELLARLRTAARLAERLHRENLELFTEEARRLLSRGDVRDAAEKAWAAYKSLLGLILATRGLPLIEERIRRTWEREGAARAEKLLEWWSGTGLLAPSARQKLVAIIDLAVEATGDKRDSSQAACCSPPTRILLPRPRDSRSKRKESSGGGARPNRLGEEEG